MKKTYILVLNCLLLISLLFAGCSSDDATVENFEDELKVVASTSWTGAMAEAAGARNVTVLAPVELRNPSEYDFKPSDVVALVEADWIILAGYEPFMNKMIEANDIDSDKIIRVTTSNTYESMVEQTRSIAERIGTLDVQGAWEQRFTEIFDIVRANAEEKDTANIKVLVHQHMLTFVKSLGFDVLEVLSADEMTSAGIEELVAQKPDLIIDSFHNPQGINLAEIIDAPRVELKNFPGPEHKGLIELILDNAHKLGLYE